MTRAAANGHKPFDLEAATEAALTDAEPFAFTFKGQVYEVPAGTKWPVSALAALGAGDLEAALSVLLGGDTFTRLCEAGLTVGQLNALFEEIGRKAGVGGLPNSSAPAGLASART